MKQIWQNTIDLLRRNPILWLPVVLGAFCEFWIGHYRIPINKSIMLALLQHSETSVLGGTVTSESPNDPFRQNIASIVVFVVSLLFSLAQIVCVVLPFFFTAIKTQRLLAPVEPQAPAGIKIKDVLLLAILTMGCMTVLFAINIFVFWFYQAVHIGLTARFYYGQAVTLIGFAINAYILSPIALRMIRPNSETELAGTQIEAARIFSFIAAVALTALSIIIFWIRLPSVENPAERTILRLILFVASSLPFTPLFVGLGILSLSASGDIEQTAGPEVATLPTS